MRKITAILSIIALFAAFGCAKKAPLNPKLAGKDLSNLPSWVLDPSIADGIGAVGIAAPSKGGIAYQIPRAELDGKGNIAGLVSSEISRVTKSAMRSAGVNENSDVDDFFSQATKEVVKNVPLSAARRVNQFVGSDGTLYIHMVLKNEDYSRFLTNSERIFESRIKRSGISQENIKRAEEATKEAFDELEKERKS